MRKVIANPRSGTENYEIEREGDTLIVNITYPPYEGRPDEGKVRYVEFDQESVRATGGIRIHFAFDRNEYVIEAPTQLSWTDDEDVGNPHWEEVACAPAWHPDFKHDD